MKRLLGLLGCVCLFVLSVVFYFYSFEAVCIVGAAAFCTIISGIFILLSKRYKHMSKGLISAGTAAIAMLLLIVLYTSAVYMPIVNNYSDKEINVSGYVCDEIIKKPESCTVTIKTDTVNGSKETLKIRISSYTDLHLEPFDKINAVVHTYAVSQNSLKSKGIFLSAYADDEFWLEATGEKQFSLYSLAVYARTAMKGALDRLLPDGYSSLCKAVSFGDKYALPSDVQSDFLVTGTSYLIVVSGMHLSVVTAFVLFIVKKLTHSRKIRCLSVCLTVTAFMALTGFTPSIVRAGIMTGLAFCSTVFLRRSDSLNSLGAAALLITVTNPYAVGDIGLLLSFTATLGIILWAERIGNYILSKILPKLRLKYRCERLKAAVNSVINFSVKLFIGLFSVSLSASIWVMPVTMLAFHRLSPINIFVSVIAGPIVSVMIVCSLISAVVYLCPFIGVLSYPFALVSGLCARAVISLIGFAAELPIASVNTDKVYFYIWLAVTVLLIGAGFLIKSRKFYIKCAVAVSLVTLTVGWAVFAVISADDVYFTAYCTENGVTASVENNNGVTLISCGGSNRRRGYAADEIAENYAEIDCLVIPLQERAFSSYQSVFVNEFDVKNVLVYDNNNIRQALLSQYEGRLRRTFGDNVSFTLNITDNVTDKIMNIDKVTYQLVSGEKTLLFVPSKGDIAALPEQFRKADYLLTDGIPQNIEIAECSTLIFSGTRDKYGEKYNSLKELNCKLLCTADDNVTVQLN